MSENRSVHWTEDENLLSEYVLGRLLQADFERMEIHLRACPQCREAVEQERLLASGIRRQARQELRARLGRNIAGRPVVVQRILTWQRAFSAVAVIVIAVGVGIYNGWFFTGDRANPAFKQEQQLSEGGEPVLQNAGRLDSLANPLSVSPIPESNPSGGKQKVENLASDKSLADQPAAASQLHDQKLSEGAQTKQPMSAASGAGGGAIPAKKESEEVEVKTNSQLSRQQFWINGAFLPSVQAAETRDHAAKKMLRESEPANQLKSRFEQAPSVEKKQGDLQNGGFELEQRSADQIPLSKQKIEQQDQTPIQTLVYQTSTGVGMIIYLDTLFSPEELRNAKITRLGADSVVVVIGAKRIGYRLSADFLDSLRNAKTGQK